MTKIDLSVIIPCYNEEKNIPLIVTKFNKAKPKNVESELVLVNNGSTDNSNRVIKKYCKKFDHIRIVHVKKNIGYGYGIYSGLKSAKGEFLCWTHGDIQTPPKDTFEAYEKIQRSKNPKKTYVKGKRYGRPLLDIFFTFGMSVFETILLWKYLYDINAQPNLFHKSFIDKIGEPPKDFSFDLYFYYMALKNRYAVVRFPVLFGKRAYGESSWNSGMKARVKFIKRTVDFTFKLKRRL